MRPAPKISLRSRPRAAQAAYAACLALALGLGLFLRGEALDGTLLADDFDHYAMQAGVYPVPRGPLDAFDFVGGNGGDRSALLEFGRLPWWASPDIELSALRPLASALVTFDYAVLGGEPFRMHAHSLLWWAFLVCAVAALYRELLPLPIACAALLLYAVDEAHGLPAIWIANRSALVAVGFVIWALWAHVAHRTRGLRFAGIGSCGLLALGLLAGEHALPALAYFATFELLFMRDRLGVRLRALAPAAVLTLAYLALHRALGYGLGGSGFYIDPFAAPLRYLRAAAVRIPLLSGDALLGMGAEWHFAGPPFADDLIDLGVPERYFELSTWAAIQLGLGVVACGLLAVLLAWLLRSPHVARERARAAGFLLAGALLSLVPVCGTLPMSRLTLAAAVGTDAALAVVLAVLARAVVAGARVAPRALAALAIVAIVAVHGVYAGVRTHDDAAYYTAVAQLEEQWVLGAEIDDTRIAGQRVFVIAAVDWASQWALPFVRHRAGRPMPIGCHVLSGAFGHGHVLTRSGDRMLDIEVQGGPARFGFLGSVYRAEDALFRGGERTAVREFDVTVLRAAGGQPVRIRVRFARPLEDDRYLFLHSTPDGLRRLHVPAVGDRLDLPPPAAPR